jgi:hypothetical protein
LRRPAAGESEDDRRRLEGKEFRMDMKVYYQKLRQVEAGISDDDVVVISLETADGGKPNVKSEVPRAIAARLVVEGRARLATAEESAEYRAGLAEAKRLAEQTAAASRMQLTVISEADLRALKGQPRAQKS